MSDAVAQILVTMGLPGAVIFVLLAAVRVLDNRNSEIQEKRLEENKLGFEALNKNSTALQALTDSISKVRRR